MINRKDWEVALKNFKDLETSADNAIVNAEMNKELYSVIKPFIENKLASMPVEKEEDKMPEEVKDILSSVAQ